MMTIHQKVFAIVASFAILVVILEMVRRRKLKEEYSWLWLLAGVSMLILSWQFDLLLWLSRLIGAENPITTIFLLGFIFLILINLDYSIQISRHKEQLKKMAHQVAIMEKTIKDFEDKK